MKKTHWLRTTLITLVACGIAGLILAVILFNANPPRTGAASSIESMNPWRVARMRWS